MSLSINNKSLKHVGLGHILQIYKSLTFFIQNCINNCNQNFGTEYDLLAEKLLKPFEEIMAVHKHQPMAEKPVPYPRLINQYIDHEKYSILLSVVLIMAVDKKRFNLSVERLIYMYLIEILAPLTTLPKEEQLKLCDHKLNSNIVATLSICLSHLEHHQKNACSQIFMNTKLPLLQLVLISESLDVKDVQNTLKRVSCLTSGKDLHSGNPKKAT